MKLKYIKKVRTTFPFLRVNGKKQKANITVDDGEIISVSDEIGKALLETGKFKKIKESKEDAELANAKEEPKIIDFNIKDKEIKGE